MNNVNLLLIESSLDTTLKFIHFEALKRGIKSQYLNYEEIAKPWVFIPKLNVNENTIAFFALPFTVNQVEKNYQAIRENYRFKGIVNNDMLTHNFLKLENKRYETYIFSKLSLPFSRFTNLHKPQFPIIARKCISGRSKNNFLIQNQQQLDTFIRKYDVTNWIFQDYHELVGDYRIFVLGDKPLCVVKRNVKILPNKRIIVKIAEESSLPKNVLRECMELTKYIGADFLGIDIGITKNGKHFFIEYNGRAQFKTTKEKIKSDIAEKILDYILNKYK
ncbi:hypothetical protein GF362_01090 [Candidatus Dojkabacteria bacterium]|nr:hypothetical protein [Candidatus Dojkabacteria bacterium]